MNSSTTNGGHINYKFLPMITMLYIVIKITSVLMIYKLTYILGTTVSVSAFVVPIWFFLGDIITEIYGFKMARKLIYTAIICQIIFSFLCAALALLPAAPGWPSNNELNMLMLHLPRIAISSTIAILMGGIVNAYALSKWKSLLQGRYFWLRSLGATAIGELFFTICSYIGEFYGSTSITTIFHLIIASYTIKLIINLILFMPVSLICFILKHAETAENYKILDNYSY